MRKKTSLPLLGIIRESDAFPGTADQPDTVYKDLRRTVRIFLEDSEGKFGFVLFPKRPGFDQDYIGTLGGGLHGSETHEEGLRREVREEIGCEIDGIVELGVIREFGVSPVSDRAEKHGAESVCYYARVKGEKGTPSYDEKEAAGNARPIWLTLGEALRVFSDQIPGHSRHRGFLLIEAVKKMKSDWRYFFRGRKITVMGLGVLGRGVGDVTFLAEQGANLTVTDLKTAEHLAPSLRKLKKFSNISYVLGEHRLEDFARADMVLKSGGVPLDSLYIAEARAHGVPVEMGESLFRKLSPATVIGVTGTRGKSTVTNLIFEILKADKRSVFLGGNVKGVATLPLLSKTKKGDIVVMELDSWRLQGFGDAHVSPQISVFTNFMRDHLNYYKGDDALYFSDKANIYRYQITDDLLVTNNATKKLIASKHFDVRGKIETVRGATIPSNWKVGIAGEHNRENVAYAVTVARACGVADAVIKKVVATWGGLPGRLESLGMKKGVLFVNDTNATTPDAVCVALDTFEKYKGKIILLGGGADKKLDYSEYTRSVASAVKHLILFRGAASEKIIAHCGTRTISVTVVDSMRDAMVEAKRHMKRGDLVLLSPGAASFGVFKNEYDRGDQFVAAVKRIG